MVYGVCIGLNRWDLLKKELYGKVGVKVWWCVFCFGGGVVWVVKGGR